MVIRNLDLCNKRGWGCGARGKKYINLRNLDHSCSDTIIARRRMVLIAVCNLTRRHPSGFGVCDDGRTPRSTHIWPAACSFWSGCGIVTTHPPGPPLGNPSFIRHTTGGWWMGRVGDKGVGADSPWLSGSVFDSPPAID